MTTTYTHYFTKDGIEDICVEYTITDIVPQTYFEPEEGGEVEILKAWIEPSGTPYVISGEDEESWSITIFENHVFEEFEEDDGI